LNERTKELLSVSVRVVATAQEQVTKVFLLLFLQKNKTFFKEMTVDTPAGAEQNFFHDPVLDRLMGMNFSLMAEVQVLRDRVAMLELLLERKGVIGRAEREAFQPDAADDAAVAADGRAFAREMLRPLLGQQASRSEEVRHAAG
jgi:hypothetical protein